MDSLSDLRKRIEANNYGIGLRTGDALQKLSVMRIPGNMRDAEMAVGRGYTVKSGQLSLVQIASPYIDIVDNTLPEEDKIPQALDAWVEMIQSSYSGDNATWWAPLSEEAETGEAVEIGKDFSSDNLLAAKGLVNLLRVVIKKQVKTDISDWSDEDVVGYFRSLWEVEGDDQDEGFSNDDLDLDMDFNFPDEDEK
jgi:hypothetical protein